MKAMIACLLIATALASSATFAQSGAPMSDKERIDSLLRQNQMLMDENVKLRAARDTPHTTHQAFAHCMQAAKGLSAMAAESVGGHCSKILK